MYQTVKILIHSMLKNMESNIVIFYLKKMFYIIFDLKTLNFSQKIHKKLKLNRKSCADNLFGDFFFHSQEEKYIRMWNLISFYAYESFFSPYFKFQL